MRFSLNDSLAIQVMSRSGFAQVFFLLLLTSSFLDAHRKAFSETEDLRASEAASQETVPQDILHSLSNLQDCDIDWEITPLGKARPVIPQRIMSARQFYLVQVIQQKLRELVKNPKTTFAGHVLLADANNAGCTFERRDDGFDANYKGLIVQVRFSGESAASKRVTYPEQDEQRKKLNEMWDEYFENYQSISEYRKKKVSRGWLDETESGLVGIYSQPTIVSDSVASRINLSFSKLEKDEISFHPVGFGSRAIPYLSKEQIAEIKTSGRAGVKRLLELLDKDETCVAAHVALTYLHNDDDIFHLWHPPSAQEPYLQEMRFNGLTIEIRGHEDWRAKYPKFDIEKHALRFYWHTLCKELEAKN